MDDVESKAPLADQGEAEGVGPSEVAVAREDLDHHVARQRLHAHSLLGGQLTPR